MQYLHPKQRKPIIRPYSFLEIITMIDQINSIEGFQYLMDCVYPERRYYTPSQQVTIGNRVAEKYANLDASKGT